MFNNAENYLVCVQECLDVLVEYGTDRYGPKHLPILVSILDVESRDCPQNPKPLDEQWRVQRRGRRNPAGANMLMDMSTLKTMRLMSCLTGNSHTVEFAHQYMDYYMRHLVDQKGLFWWGWHRHYDVYKDEMDGHGGNVHELHAMNCIVWDALWEINPEAVQKEIEAIWQWHVIDKDTGEIDRHDSGKQGCDFSMSSGAFIYAFTFMHSRTGDKIWQDRARLLATYYWNRRNQATDLFSDRPNAGSDRFDGSHFVTAIVGLHCHALLKSYHLSGDRLLRDYAIAYLAAYAKFGFDHESGKFWGSLNLDGSPVYGPRIKEGYASQEPRGHLDFWGPYVCGYQYPIYAAQAYTYAYHLTEEEEFLTTAKRFADYLRNHPPAQGCLEESWYQDYALQYSKHGTYAGKNGRSISFLIHLYVMTQDAEYLDLASDMADEAISKLYHQGLFRGHPAKPYYEATDGVGFLLYALLQLSQILKNPQDVLAKREIVLNQGKTQKTIIDLDNW